ncbi:MAG: efflux RND transporter periplasmic adaptor subunit [SAR324 cluster bacterium]|nr:efflux RND transporter periplasmic adaptor subunit [SAR324 cluster bacterium]
MIKISYQVLRSSILICMLLVFILGKTADTKSAERKKITNVEVIKLSPRKLMNYATYIGHLKPANRVTLSSEIPGVIQKAAILTGQSIKKGEVLIQFETQKLLLNKRLTESNYSLALMDYEREQSLFLKNLSTLAKVSALKNRLDINKVQLDMTKLELEKSKIISPLNGVIAKKYVEEGEYIGLGKMIVEVIDIDSVLAVVNIPELEIRFVKLNKQINITLDALKGKQYVGFIKTISLEADPKSRSFAAEVEILNPDRDLLPGMLARLKMLTLSIDRQVLIPRHTIQEEENGSFVYIVKDNRSVKKRIEIGISVNNEVQVVSGLNFGDFIVETGQQLITDQEPVKVVEIKKQTS